MDQVFPAAVVAVIVILVLAGIVRAVGRRPSPHDDTFGAGGTSAVAPGTRGTVVTEIAPTGVVQAVGEPWTARSADGRVIPAGTAVRVTDHDGLTLIVEIDRSAGTTGE